MKYFNKRFVPLCALTLSLSACFSSAANTSEMRLTYHPPNPEDCAVEFLQLSLKDMYPTSPFSQGYEHIGNVMVPTVGSGDPLSEEMRDIVNPRACKMGGNAVGVAMVANSSRDGEKASTLAYSVYRKIEAAEPQIQQSNSM